jgi:hypothetical protein
MKMNSMFDPRRIPAITLRQEEIEEAKYRIEIGELPPNFFELHEEAKAKATFGHDYKRDRNGKPIEQGVGSPGNESINHFISLKKAEQAGIEPFGSYDKAVAAMFKRDPERARKLGLQQPLPAAGR